jgi:K+-sensing histidine kinase KdpD
MTSYRISLVWYVGRVFSLVSSCLVLIVLLAESTMLYSRVTAPAETKKGELATPGTETLDVLLKSIAHDLLQRLSAIMANGSAGVLMLKHNPQNPAELRATFEDIVSEGRNAAKIVESIRSIYAASSISTSKYPEHRH